MRRLDLQTGSLLIPVIFLVIVVSVIATTIMYLTFNRSTRLYNDAKRVDAYYIAQAGIERATYALLTNTIADQVSCPNIAANFTSVSFGDGQFSLTSTFYNPTTTTLTAAVSNSATVIPVVSTTGYAPKGAVLIDSEVIRYNQLGAAPNCNGYNYCFLGALRGQLNTTIAAHVISSNVQQNECILNAQGGVPTLTNSDATQTITAGVQLTANSTGNGWMTGSKHANGNETTVHFDGTTWTQIGPNSSIPNVTYNGVYASINNTGWIVGDKQGTVPVILYTNGTNLSTVTLTASKIDLYGVTCVISNDCWITGESAGLLHWDGSSWTQAATASNVPSVTYRAVDCTNTSNCWAVGELDSGTAAIVQWNGTTWSRVVPNSATNQTLYGVACLAANNCWAVGDASLIAHWDGTAWTKVGGTYIGASVPANVDLRGITCTDSTHCWAVGTANANKATILFYNGTTWMRDVDDGTLLNQQFNSVSCNNNKSCYAVGNAGAMASYNGTTWSNYISSFSDINYLGIYMSKLGTTAIGVGAVVYVEA